MYKRKKKVVDLWFVSTPLVIFTQIQFPNPGRKNLFPFHDHKNNKTDHRIKHRIAPIIGFKVLY